MAFALNYLTAPALITATADWIDTTLDAASRPTNPVCAAIRQYAGDAAWSGMAAARGKVVVAVNHRMPEDAASLRMEGLNARYDETGRTVRGLIKAARDGTTDARLEQELIDMDAALFPERGRHFQKSMADQGGDAEVRASAVTPRHRELLRRMVSFEVTGEQFLSEHLEVGQGIRSTVNAATAAAVASDAEPNRVMPRAKAKFIKTIRNVLSTMEENPECPAAALELVRSPLQRAAAAAQSDALARRAPPGSPAAPAAQ